MAELKFIEVPGDYLGPTTTMELQADGKFTDFLVTQIGNDFTVQEYKGEFDSLGFENITRGTFSSLDAAKKEAMRLFEQR